MKRSLYLFTPKGLKWKTKPIYCSLFPLYTPNAFLLLFHKTLLQIIKHDHWHPQDWVLGTIKWACPLGKVLAQVGLKVIIQQFLPVVLPCSYISLWISYTRKVTVSVSLKVYPKPAYPQDKLWRVPTHVCSSYTSFSCVEIFKTPQVFRVKHILYI